MKFFKIFILKLLPAKLRKAVIHEFKVKEYAADLGHHQISFSQQGEDILLAKFFTDKHTGFYVDVGAFHPVTYSNTYMLYRKGWRGINIDPNPEAIKLFEAARKDDVNLQVAVASTQSEFTYTLFNHGAINTLDEKHAAHWSSIEGFAITSKHKLVTIPLKDLLEEYLPLGTAIDFMNIDVEGFDLEVLRSNDWNKYRPGLLMVEIRLLHPSDFEGNEILHFLHQVNYSVYSICNGTVAFVDTLNVQRNNYIM